MDELTFEMIENAQNEAGFFDENLIWADFEKIREIRLIDFIQAVLISGYPVTILDPLFKSTDNQKELFSLVFKITYMLDEK